MKKLLKVSIISKSVSVIAVMDKATEKSDQQPVNTLLSLPSELLVYVLSFLTVAQDKITLRYVCQRLRNCVSETPSLWREFI